MEGEISMLTPRLVLVTALLIVIGIGTAGATTPQSGHLTLIYSVDERGEIRPCG